MRILFATHNQHKLREIQEILSNFPGTILCAKDLGMDQEVEENGTSFLENAEIKARALYNFAKAQGLLEEDDLVMADDSGLSIEALSFGPGIYSARFLGQDTPYPEKNRRILAMMEESSSKSRMAYFTCAIVAIFADGKLLQTEARCTGEIAKEPGGEEGFGYDPIFYLPEYRKTAAELSREEKNKISHRGKALRKMERMIQEEQEKRDSARFSKAGQEQSGKGKEAKAEHKAENVSLRQNLNDLYGRFVRLYGHLNDRKNHEMILMDAGGREILFLERKMDGKMVKADIFSQPVSFSLHEVTQVETAADALPANRHDPPQRKREKRA